MDDGQRQEAKHSVLRETDDEARSLARRLVRGARHAALGVIDPESGFPNVSRALVATDEFGQPVLLVSALSAHTAGLREDGRASLLFGEPGKGDPLAHPRITVQCRAGVVSRSNPARTSIRRRFLNRHPKSQLYVDFPDFSFFRLEITGAGLNAGFGKAYALSAHDLTIASPAAPAILEMEQGALEHMNADHADAVSLYAAFFAGEKTGAWRMTGIDAEGFEIASGDRLHRIEFDLPLQDPAALRKQLAEMAKRARAKR